MTKADELLALLKGPKLVAVAIAIGTIGTIGLLVRDGFGGGLRVKWPAAADQEGCGKHQNY